MFPTTERGKALETNPLNIFADGAHFRFHDVDRTTGSAVFSVSVNGSFAAPNGVAFSGIDACYLIPALSGNGRHKVNFGGRPFTHPLPSGDFMSVHDFPQTERHA